MQNFALKFKISLELSKFCSNLTKLLIKIKNFAWTQQSFTQSIKILHKFDKLWLKNFFLNKVFDFLRLLEKPVGYFQLPMTVRASNCNSTACECRNDFQIPSKSLQNRFFAVSSKFGEFYWKIFDFLGLLEALEGHFKLAMVVKAFVCKSIAKELHHDLPNRSLCP